MQNNTQDDFIKMISILYRKTQMYMNERLKEEGITSGQVPFLIHVCEQGVMVQSRFCNILDMDKSTVAKMLSKLEHQGYVVRKQNEKDCRAVDVYPTDKAKNIYPCLKRMGIDWTKEVTGQLESKQVKNFFQSLDAVTDRAVVHFSE